AHYLAATLYTYAFLFPEDAAQRPDGLDPRTRMAADLYNRAVARAFVEHGDNSYVVPRGGRFALPFGEVDIAFAPESFDWQGYRLVEFAPVDRIRIEGLINRYRDPGIGAALVARPQPLSGDYSNDDLIGPNVRVPVTAFLRFERPREQLAATSLHATLELHSIDDEHTVR